MGKLNVVVLRYLSRDDFRVLTAVSIFYHILIANMADLSETDLIKLTETINLLYNHVSGINIVP